MGIAEVSEGSASPSLEESYEELLLPLNSSYWYSNN